jgi:hypothetical protein
MRQSKLEEPSHSTTLGVLFPQQALSVTDQGAGPHPESVSQAKNVPQAYVLLPSFHGPYISSVDAREISESFLGDRP